MAPSRRKIPGIYYLPISILCLRISWFQKEPAASWERPRSRLHLYSTAGKGSVSGDGEEDNKTLIKSRTGQQSDSNINHKGDRRQKNPTHVPCLTWILFFSEMELTSGELALGILGLGACENQDEEFIRGARLVSKLEAKFQAEIQNMGENHVLRGPRCLCLSSTDSEPYRVSTYSLLLFFTPLISLYLWRPLSLLLSFRCV